MYNTRRLTDAEISRIAQYAVKQYIEMDNSMRFYKEFAKQLSNAYRPPKQINNTGNKVSKLNPVDIEEWHKNGKTLCLKH